MWQNNCFSRISFTATRSTSLTKGFILVPFENMSINDGGVFNLHTHKFMAPFSGFYWIHFSVSIPNETWADVRLLGYDKPLDIMRQHTNFTGTSITTSRDGILLLQDATELWLSSDYALYSDQYMQTSFSGFPLTSMFDPLSVFSVARSSSLESQNRVKISYDIVNIDTANAWDSVNNEYVVPFYGTYIISLSTGAYPKAGHVVEIRVNNVHLASNIFYDSSHSGIDIVSRTIITTLKVRDRLHTQCPDKLCSLYSSIRYQLTTLVGFLYSPYRTVPIAWCVAKKISDPVRGEVYSFEFDRIFIDEGNGWRKVTNRYFVPLAGVYYIHITTGTNNAYSKLELMRNGLPITNVQVESKTTSNFATSRAIILRLKRHEELFIRLPSGYLVISNNHEYASFSGFRIYA